MQPRSQGGGVHGVVDDDMLRGVENAGAAGAAGVDVAPTAVAVAVQPDVEIAHLFHLGQHGDGQGGDEDLDLEFPGFAVGEAGRGQIQPVVVAILVGQIEGGLDVVDPVHVRPGVGINFQADRPAQVEGEGKAMEGTRRAGTIGHSGEAGGDAGVRGHGPAAAGGEVVGAVRRIPQIPAGQHHRDRVAAAHRALAAPGCPVDQHILAAHPVRDFGPDQQAGGEGFGVAAKVGGPHHFAPVLHDDGGTALGGGFRGDQPGGQGVGDQRLVIFLVHRGQIQAVEQRLAGQNGIVEHLGGLTVLVGQEALVQLDLGSISGHMQIVLGLAQGEGGRIPRAAAIAIVLARHHHGLLLAEGEAHPGRMPGLVVHHQPSVDNQILEARCEGTGIHQEIPHDPLGGKGLAALGWGWTGFDISPVPIPVAVQPDVEKETTGLGVGLLGHPHREGGLPAILECHLSVEPAIVALVFVGHVQPLVEDVVA